MEVKAHGKQLRISPKKVRPILDLIRGEEVGKAATILKFSGKKAGKLVLKVLNSAKANAEHNFNLNPEDLKVEKAFVSGGPTRKGWRAVSRGRAHPILKRTSHVTIVLAGEEEKSLTAEKKSVKNNSAESVKTKANNKKKDTKENNK